MERRCILGVFAHPDDETSCAGGIFTRYVREGVEVHVVTATRGEQGTLGTGGRSIAREELPAVREAELRAVLQVYGVHPPVLLDYRDQEMKDADFQVLVGQVLEVMERVRPDVVITFGPTGISRHDDHIAIHRATVEAFHRHRASTGEAARLFYVALSQEANEHYNLGLEGPEASPTTLIDVAEQREVKVRALRTYASQEDAQELAGIFERSPFGDTEAFHQAYPPVPDGEVSRGFWPEP